MLIVPVDIATEFPRKWQIPVLLSNGSRDTLIQLRTAYTKLAEADLCVPCDLPAEYLFEHTYFVVGAHPYSAPDYNQEAEQRLFELLEHPLCVGVGEIGLDFGPYCEVPERSSAKHLSVSS